MSTLFGSRNSFKLIRLVFALKDPPLVNFPHLRTIILDIRGFDTYLTTALAHLPTNVPELIIQFRQYYELGYDPDFRWEDLEAALNRFSFKKLVICREMDASPFSGVFQPPISPREERQIVQRPLAPETKAIIEENLSSFTKRGVLHWETDLVIFSGLLSEWTHYGKPKLCHCPVTCADFLESGLPGLLFAEITASKICRRDMLGDECVIDRYD